MDATSLETPLLATLVDGDVPGDQHAASGGAPWSPTPNDVAPGVVRRAGRAIARGWENLLGIVSLWCGLAFLAALPGLNVLSLGYLLESGGRVARTGRIRDGFVGLPAAARIGTVCLGTWLWLWPARGVATIWQAAYLIDPASDATRQWRLAFFIVVALTSVHVLWAWQRGGRLRHFLWPAPLRFWRWLRSHGKYTRVRDATWEFVANLRLDFYFWLGLRGLVGAILWLGPPITLLALATRDPSALNAAISIMGGVMLAIVLLYLPFLQAQFAASGQFGDLFGVRRARQAFRRAPLAFFFALLITLTGALPLYLLKIEWLPREVTWLPCLVFVATIWPARLLTAWSVSRGTRRERPRTWLLTITTRLAMLPIAAAYVVLVYFTQFLLWNGIWSMYEQHAFLTPAPF